MHKLIGFAGPAGCGKTTSAMLLENLLKKEAEEKAPIVMSSFAQPLKRCLSTLFDFSPDQLYTMEGKETVDERYGVTPRVIMQRFGTEFIRTTVPDLWEILMYKTIATCRASKAHLIIDDIRFPGEADLVRRSGGAVVHIVGRAEERGSHESERALLASEEDLILYNDGILSELKGGIRSLLC